MFQPLFKIIFGTYLKNVNDRERMETEDEVQTTRPLEKGISLSYRDVEDILVALEARNEQ